MKKNRKPPKMIYLSMLSTLIMVALTAGFVGIVQMVHFVQSNVVYSRLNTANAQNIHRSVESVAAPFTGKKTDDTAGHLVQGVPLLSQFPELPTGCEPTSLTMVLQWAGLSVKKTEVADSLAKEDIPSEADAVTVGGDPELGYIGDPHMDNGFGVYHSPIAKELDHYLPGKSIDLTGSDFSDLLAVLDSGRPIVAWITYELAEPYLNSDWITRDGREIQWLVPEHCVVMVGYTSKEIIVNNPYTGQTQRYDRNLFKTRWEQMGKQAVTLTNQPAKA